MQDLDTPGLNLVPIENEIEHAVYNLPAPPADFNGRGILIGAGGYRHFTNAWVSARMLRRHGCNLPIQFWYMGDREMSDIMRRLAAPYDVECIDAAKVARTLGVSEPRGAEIQAFSVAYSKFKEVLALDSNSLPIRNPEYLFNASEYHVAGAVLWRGLYISDTETEILQALGISAVQEFEIDAGQLLVNKEYCWEAIAFGTWLKTQATFASRVRDNGAGFRLAWKKFGLPIISPAEPQFLPARMGCCAGGMICHHDFSGERVFQHRTRYPWKLFGANARIPGAFFEAECEQLVCELRELWNGRCEDRSKVSSAPESVLEELLNTVWIDNATFPAGWIRPEPSQPLEESLQISAERHGSEATENNDLTAARPSGNNDEKKWSELHFSANGTLGTSSGKLVFWDMEMDGNCPVLRIYGPPGVFDFGVRLQKSDTNSWIGRYVASGGEGDVTLSPLSRASDEPVCATTVHSRLKRRFTAGLTLVNSSDFLGDHIVGLYAATAASNTGLNVTFYTRYAEWLKRVEHPGLTVSSEVPENWEASIADGSLVDLNRNYAMQIRYGESRVSWYANNISQGLIPERPHSVDRRIHMPRFDFSRYIIMAPGSGIQQRWPLSHWIRLIQLAGCRGVEVVVFGTPADEQQVMDIAETGLAFGVINDSPDWITDALLSAKAVVTLDCGIAHLAGLLATPTIAIHSHLSPDFLWGLTQVQGLTPATSCTSCRWSTDRGYHPACSVGCSALASVTPEQVLARLNEFIGNP